MTNNEYWQYYAGREVDSVLILDNGAYEGWLDITRFENVIESMKPEVVVLPDIYLGNWERSLHLSLGYLDITKATLCEFMFVPQAEPGDMQGFMQALTTGLQDKRVSWVALPRCLATDIARNTLARCFMAEFIRKEFPHVKIHALGMVDGNLYELAYLAERGVYSCDSSAPVWRGMNGLFLSDLWEGPDVDFDSKLADNVAAELNLKEVDNACQFGIRLGKRNAVQTAASEDSESSGEEPHFDRTGGRGGPVRPS